MAGYAARLGFGGLVHRDDGGATPDYSSRFNTPLSQPEEAAFQQWGTQQAPVLGRNPAQDTRDYDTRGFWLSGQGFAGNGHSSDRFKKPNHPTFSTQSQYNRADGGEGGTWTGGQGGQPYAFHPSATNLMMYPPDALRGYFQARERGNRLDLPQQRADGGAMPVQTQAMQNPIAQQEYSHFSAMTPEQLQETAVRLGASPQGAMVQRILQQKRMTPQPTAQPDLAGMPQQYAIGGTLQPKGGVHMPERAPPSGATPPTAGGFLHTAGPGRSDNLNIKPHADSYVLPADVVSGLGEGNSLAGAKALEASFHSGPYGTPMPAGPRHTGHRMGAAPKMPGGGGFHLGIPHALGGAANDNFGFGGAPAANDNAGRGHNGGPPLDDDEDDGPRRVPIVAAGGEYIVSPDQCRALGHGDITRGHEILDKFVLHVRKRTVGELRKLKGPVKS